MSSKNIDPSSHAQKIQLNNHIIQSDLGSPSFYSFISGQYIAAIIFYKGTIQTHKQALAMQGNWELMPGFNSSDAQQPGGCPCPST